MSKLHSRKTTALLTRSNLGRGVWQNICNPRPGFSTLWIIQGRTPPGSESILEGFSDVQIESSSGCFKNKILIGFEKALNKESNLHPG